MSMHIISPGMLTTVQDLGRRGYMASGFQQGGAMDQFAARAANSLLDNSLIGTDFINQFLKLPVVLLD